ncbi:dUTP diphosphatase [Dethiosulfovibrio salsuginis]|uniref:Deoxyuridine 5'-triphosphate nucleotidohydrolase n=1 Tax=Dethiosulfovibrio salsuginis TaxID=561720 RepID=A0A1X7ISR6_9BACT|nr:dUTP diphosphatase [Dethiosulfovibrio salsuginis]SMG18217.1 deoxyuridine 5'-triphosphate nucleotidohydrolase [Dethiosulfovibrio salsuginis]
MDVFVPVVREGEAQRLPLPRYETEGSAGMDLLASEAVAIPPGRCEAVPTGLKIAVPVGFEAQIRPRSGLALKKSILVPNSPGTIDSDYRGEVKVILMNLGDSPFEVSPGDRIAQMVLTPVVRAVWEDVDSLDSTERGEGGFGSTGLSSSPGEVS